MKRWMSLSKISYPMPNHGGGYPFFSLLFLFAYTIGRCNKLENDIKNVRIKNELLSK